MMRAVLALVAFALLPACSQQGLPAAALLSGTYDLALVGDLLFVTSADRSELRVLDLSADPRDFVRAPNPIEPLSIPVVERPVGIARDVHYNESGAEVGGPYVYAHSSAQAISVVGATRPLLKEVKRLVTPGPVIALSARGPDASRSYSRLYYAISTSGSSEVWQVDLPGPDQLDASSVPSPQLVHTLPGEFVSALLALPDPESLVIATRSGVGGTGSTFRLNTTTGATTTYGFPGPVRMLVTHPAANRPGSENVPAKSLTAAQRVFGVLDEGACGTAGAVCRGILAVEAATGERSKDATGLEMLPISVGRALPLGLTFTPDAFVVVPRTQSTSSEKFALLGIGTASDGRIFFFDALDLRMLDGNPNPAVAQDFTLQKAPEAAPGPIPPNTGITSAQVSEGATLDERISVVYRAIPGLVKLAAPAPGSSHFPADHAGRAQPGDEVQLSGCETKLVVTAVTASGFDTDQPMPISCAGTFTVHAPEAEPFIVQGSVSGDMGRTRHNGSFTFDGTYYHRPEGYTGAPQLRFSMGNPDPNIQPGWTYSFLTTSGFAPLHFQPDRLVLPASFLPTLPGSVVHLVGETTAFVAYPSANGILEFSPGFIVPNGLTARNVKAYQ